MIRLTRLDGSEFYINAEHIQTVESTPDTHILLTNGQHYVVTEPAARVAALTIDYQRKIRTRSAERGTRSNREREPRLLFALPRPANANDAT